MTRLRQAAPSFLGLPLLPLLEDGGPFSPLILPILAALTLPGIAVLPLNSYMRERIEVLQHPDGEINLAVLA